MKKTWLALLAMILWLPLLSGCNPVVPEGGVSQSTAENAGSGTEGGTSQSTTENVTSGTGSAQERYQVEILNSNGHRLLSELKSAYAPGETITIKLGTITEHYYVVTVNGVELRPDPLTSGDWTYTYYTFIMPRENVTVKIEDRWVDIPESL